MYMTHNPDITFICNLWNVYSVTMASFEAAHGNQPEALEYKKYPLRRMEPAIKKFLTVIQIDLARLHRHKLNVEKVFTVVNTS